MNYVHVLVEGQTEEGFVRDILNEYLAPQDLYLNAILAKTKQAKGGLPAFRGGIVSYGKVEGDIRRLMHDSGVIAVTTMLDYYQLPIDFPGYNDTETQQPDCYKAVAYLEETFAESIRHQNFIPYLAIHEFEALLFSEPEKIVTAIPDADADIAHALQDIRDNFNTPEEINKLDPPSKRLRNYIPKYQKTVHGLKIAQEIGIDTMRGNVHISIAGCRSWKHFNLDSGRKPNFSAAMIRAIGLNSFSPDVLYPRLSCGRN